MESKSNQTILRFQYRIGMPSKKNSDVQVTD